MTLNISVEWNPLHQKHDSKEKEKSELIIEIPFSNN